MFFSKRLGLLFVAAPKTGSTSVEAYLLQIDPEGERFKITLGDQIIDSRHVASPSLGHATASELRQVLGPRAYESLNTFGFVRHPFEKLVSTYFFLQQGSFRSALKVRSSKNRWGIMLRQLSGFSLARMLPFWLWARIWPMKKCSDYFVDDTGTLIVDYLGCTDRLGEDLDLILQAMGISPSSEVVPHINRSKHSNARNYIGAGGLRRHLERKYREDIALFELVRDGYFKRGRAVG